MTTTLKYAYIISPEMDAAHRFYTSVLGMRTNFRDGDRWLEMQGVTDRLSLAAAEEAPKEATGTILVFECADLDQTCQVVTQSGGQIVDTRDMGAHGRTATVEDPNGNLFQLFSKQARK